MLAVDRADCSTHATPVMRAIDGFAVMVIPLTLTSLNCPCPAAICQCLLRYQLRLRVTFGHMLQHMQRCAMCYTAARPIARLQRMPHRPMSHATCATAPPIPPVPGRTLPLFRVREVAPVRDQSIARECHKSQQSGKSQEAVRRWATGNVRAYRCTGLPCVDYGVPCVSHVHYRQTSSTANLIPQTPSSYASAVVPSRWAAQHRTVSSSRVPGVSFTHA